MSGGPAWQGRRSLLHVIHFPKLSRVVRTEPYRILETPSSCRAGEHLAGLESESCFLADPMRVL